MSDFTYHTPLIKSITNKDDGSKLIAEAGHIALMCPKCFNMVEIPICHTMHLEGVFNKIEFFNTQNTYYGSCPNCKEDVEFESIDSNMAQIINILNTKGYYTAFCCEGHIQPDDFSGIECVSIPYIYFYFWSDSDILNTNPLPDSWYIAPDDEMAKVFSIKNRVLNKTMESIEDHEEFINWVKYNWDHKKQLEDIYNWALSLPDKNTFTKKLQYSMISNKYIARHILESNADNSINAHNELINENDENINSDN